MIISQNLWTLKVARGQTSKRTKEALLKIVWFSRSAHKCVKIIILCGFLQMSFRCASIILVYRYEEHFTVNCTRSNKSIHCSKSLLQFTFCMANSVYVGRKVITTVSIAKVHISNIKHSWKVNSISLCFYERQMNCYLTLIKIYSEYYAIIKIKHIWKQRWLRSFVLLSMMNIRTDRRTVTQNYYKIM